MQNSLVHFFLLGLASLMASTCKSTQASEEKAIPIFSSPGQFFIVKGRLVPRSGSIRLLSIHSVSSFKATRPRLPTCSSSLPKEGLETLGPGAHKNVITNFNRAKLVGLDSFEVEIPKRLGPALNVCGFEPMEPPLIELTVINQVGSLEKFSLLIEPAKVMQDRQSETLDLLRPQPLSVSIAAEQSELELRLPELSATPSKLSAQTSFNQVWQNIVKTQLPAKPLPKETGISSVAAGVGVLGNAIGIDGRDERVRADQQRALSSTLDTRSDTAKAFHPLGVCAKARWRVSGSSRYNGLFRPSTDLPAIIRFSTGGNNTTVKPELGFHRMPAIAVKIFPGNAQDSNVLTESRNILLFDEQGPLGNKQSWFIFDSLDGKNKHFFANWIFGTDPVAEGTVQAFSHLKFNARHLPLTALASVRADGSYENAADIEVPHFIKVSYDGKRKPEKFNDLREELLNYGESELHFKVMVFPEDTSPDELRSSDDAGIAELTAISAPILSSYCDRSLFFHHAPH